MALQYVLTGFTQDSGFRVFAFARIEEDRTRTEFTVRADLALSRRYLIPMQELPLLCRNFLARREDLGNSRSVIFNEEEMRLYASNCAMAKRGGCEQTQARASSVRRKSGSGLARRTRQDPAHAPANRRSGDAAEGQQRRRPRRSSSRQGHTWAELVTARESLNACAEGEASMKDSASFRMKMIGGIVCLLLRCWSTWAVA
jgi:hypothetical protein